MPSPKIARKPKIVSVASTDWVSIEVDAVANYPGDVKIGPRRYNKKSTCFTQKIQMTVTGESWRKLYAIAKHIHGECEPKICKYCRMERKG